MSSNPNNINYVVTYDSDINSVSPIFLGPLTNVQFQRNITPADDNATITIAGIGYTIANVQYPIEAAREIYIYRQNSDGTTTLKFRGMTTNPTYKVSDDGLVTTIQVNSLWYMLSIRLFQIAGKSPPPLQPNTNPYILYLNPTIGLDFGTIWSDILVTAFQGSYTTGHLPTFHLANLTTNGMQNPAIPAFTDFDYVVVNDNLYVQYMSISQMIDKVVTSALFGPNTGSPYLAEYRMDIGDLIPQGAIVGTTTSATATVLTDINLSLTPNALIGQYLTYTSGPAAEQYRVIASNGATTITTASFSPAPTLGGGDTFEVFPPSVTPPNLPTVTVMLFDPAHSKLGNGNNRTGIWLGDNSIDPYPTAPADLLFPMDYVEFGVTNGFAPIDTIIFSEGDNVVSTTLTYDYLSMNNNYVLTGGSFQGSDVVALPISNQRSIAEFGLKQTNTSLQNVVDTAEIQRYVGTSISFFQYPIPNIVVVPDYTYASSHILYAGDYVLLNTPSLAGVFKDSNGNVLAGSYSSLNPSEPIVAAYTARIKTIDITWNPDDGEAITLTFTFPVYNLPIEEWGKLVTPTGTIVDLTTTGSNAGAIQTMYPYVAPSFRTTIGKGTQQESSALYQAGGDFLANRNNPATVTVIDTGSSPNIVDDTEFLSIPINAQILTNSINSVVATGQTACSGSSTSGTNVLHVVNASSFQAENVIVISQGTATSESNVITGITLIGAGSPYFTLQNNLQFTQTNGNSVFAVASLKGDSALIYQFGVEVNINNTTSNSSTATNSADDVYLTIIQPDGMAIFDSILPLSQAINILTLISQSHTPPFVLPWQLTFTETLQSSSLLSEVEGNYLFVFRNSKALPWIPTPLFASLPAPTLGSYTTGVGTGMTDAYIYCPVLYDSTTSTYYEGAMSYPTYVTIPNFFTSVLTLTWPIVPHAVGYNVYRFNKNAVKADADILSYLYVDGYPSVTTPTYTDTNPNVSGGTSNTQPFDTPYNAPTGVRCYYNETHAGARYFTSAYYYWYLITALNPEGVESAYSQVATPYSPSISNFDNSVAEPHGNSIAQPIAPEEIELVWPAVPNAQSYNIYRVITPSTSRTIPNAYTDYTLIQSGVTITNFTDDGVSFPNPGSPVYPPTSLNTIATNNTYTVYVNYSFNPDPAFTKTASKGSTQSPSSVVVTDPTLQVSLLPSPYVAP